ncbi:MAG: hypothetical protein J2P54_09270 [Bradyrhizobiaceae bacterium]|nr:hypothetical protein [Bradyrhizobiaceae bacterium]
MTKTKSSKHRRLIAECRERWNRFDPIGIRGMHADHLNEYDPYLAHTAELLLADADSFKIAAYVRQVVRVSMGISNFPEERIIEFVQELKRLTVPDLLDVAVQIWREAQVVHNPSRILKTPSEAMVRTIADEMDKHRERLAECLSHESQLVAAYALLVLRKVNDPALKELPTELLTSHKKITVRTGCFSETMELGALARMLRKEALRRGKNKA